MRTMFFALVASLTVASSAALAQAEKCAATYGNCMNTCATGKVKLGQDRCVENCQAQSNTCYERTLGARPQTIVTGERPLAVGDALASEKPRAAPPAAPQAVPAPPAPAAAPTKKQLPR